MQRVKQLLGIIFLFFILIIVLGFTIKYFPLLQNKVYLITQSLQSTKTPNQTVQLLPESLLREPIPDGWTRYINENNGYMINIPENWLLKTEDQIISSYQIFSNNEHKTYVSESGDVIAELRIQGSSDIGAAYMFGKTVGHFRETGSDYDEQGRYRHRHKETKLEDFEVDDFPAVKYIIEPLRQGETAYERIINIIYLIKKEPFIYEITFSAVDKITINSNIEIFDQIIQSVRFLPSPNLATYILTVHANPDQVDKIIVTKKHKIIGLENESVIDRKRANSSGKTVFNLPVGEYIISSTIEYVPPVEVYLDRNKQVRLVFLGQL